MVRLQRFACSLAVVLVAHCLNAQALPKPDLLVTHAHLFTMAADERAPFDGYVTVAADGTILDVGHGDPPSTLHAVHTVDAGGDWMMPGLISAHSHLWQAAFRGLAEDKSLPGWIDDLYGAHVHAATPEDSYWFCLYGALDHLQHGVTTAFDFAMSGGAEPNTDSRYDKAQFRAESAGGIRFVHAWATTKVTPTVTLPAERARLADFLAWVHAQPPSKRFLSVMINGATAFNNTERQAAVESSLMREFHLANQTHYLEQPEDVPGQQAKFAWMTSTGLVQHDLLFGHFIHVSEPILATAAGAHAAMVWNPLSNGRLASGVPDIPRYLAAGLRVGMGVDGEASADLADPFENMRTGLYAIRDKYQSAAIMSPYDVLRLHTLGSADVLNVADKLGSLEPGKYADFLLVSPARLGAVTEDPYANLVFVTGEPDIDSVWVGGVKQVDHDHVLQGDLARAAGESRRRVLAESATHP